VGVGDNKAEFNAMAGRFVAGSEIVFLFINVINIDAKI
jgi:hypothetical protein